MPGLRSPSSPLERTRAISKNFFLHIHTAKLDPYVLRPAYTFGLGIIAVSLFVILLCSGILLLFYYTPSVERAYFSILDITYVVPGGRFLRNLHRWSAHGMVFITLLHLARVFYTGAYSRGRGLVWVSGIILLILVLSFSFSGYLLPWDQLAYWAVTIASNITNATRELAIPAGIDPGRLFKAFLLGGEQVGQSTLTRFFLLHVVFLPVTTLLMLGYHFWRMRKSDGLCIPRQPAGEQNVGTEPPSKLQSWPVLVWAEVSIFVATLAAVLLFAYLFDAPLRSMADPALPENPAKSPWYFLGVQELVSYSAFTGGIVIPLALLTGLFLIPALDREDRLPGIWFSGRQGFRIFLYSMVFALPATIGAVALSPFTAQLFRGNTILTILLNPGMFLAVVFAVWALLIGRTYHSPRFSAIALFTVSATGFVVLTITGLWFRGPDWQFIWF
jgi:quinol-cytochrome oxidoreductase complex cytochrome b subunit